MTSEQAFRFITRGIAIFCIITALIALTYLPPDSMEAAHYWHNLNIVGEASRPNYLYLFRYYLLRTAVLVLQISALFWAAGWFYRGGPTLQRFFLDDQNPTV